MNLFINVFQLVLLIIIYLLAYLHGKSKGFREGWQKRSLLTSTITEDELSSKPTPIQVILKKPVDKPFTRG